MTETGNRKTRSSKLSALFDPAAFQLPIVELSAFDELTEENSATAREAYQKLQALAGESTRVFKDACSVAAKGAADYNRLFAEFVHANASACFDYAVAMSGAKSPSEAIELSTAYTRKQLEAVTEQARSLTVLGQKMAAELAEPITKALDKTA